MIKFFIFILTLLLSNILYAEDLITIRLNNDQIVEDLQCSEDISGFSIEFENSLYEIEFPYFYSTAVINEQIVCNLFLDWLRSSTIESRQDFKIDLIKRIKKKSTLYAFNDNKILDYCINLGFCYRNIFDYFKINPKLRACQPEKNFKDLYNDFIPKFRKPYLNIIKDLEIEIFPFKPFANKYLDFLLDNNDGENYSSTMTLGLATVNKMSEVLLTSTSKKFLNFDGGLVFAKREQEYIYDKFKLIPNFYTLPITSGYDFKSLYHWKYSANSKSNKSFLTSMNLSTPENSIFVDAIYNFNDPQIRDELIQRHINLANRQCQKTKDIDCLVDFSEPQANIKKLIKTNFQKSCEAISRLKIKNKITKKDSYLIDNSNTNFISALSELIDQAKEEIIVSSHQFTSLEVRNLLIKAKKRGIKIYIFTTHIPNFDLKELSSNFFSAHNIQEQFVMPHIKMILIDDKLLYFSTANFSTNAINNSYELAGISDSKKAINTLLPLIHSYKKIFLPKLKRNKLPILENQYIVLKKIGVLPNYTQNLDEPWMKHYAKILPEGREKLQKCGLDDLLFISEKDYLECVG